MPQDSEAILMAKERLTLQEQANRILEQAQERGVSSNFFFVTTFKRYQVQMKILSDLEAAINEYGATVSKAARTSYRIQPLRNITKPQRPPTEQWQR